MFGKFQPQRWCGKSDVERGGGSGGSGKAQAPKEEGQEYC